MFVRVETLPDQIWTVFYSIHPLITRLIVVIRKCAVEAVKVTVFALFCYFGQFSNYDDCGETPI